MGDLTCMPCRVAGPVGRVLGPPALGFEGIRAVDAYGVSVKDLALIVSVFFFGAGARGLAKFWTISKNGFSGKGKQPTS